jgi:hypothetical protein
MAIVKLIISIIILILIFMLPYLVIIIGGNTFRKVSLIKMTSFSAYLVFILIISMLTYIQRPSLLNML